MAHGLLLVHGNSEDGLWNSKEKNEYSKPTDGFLHSQRLVSVLGKSGGGFRLTGACWTQGAAVNRSRCPSLWRALAPADLRGERRGMWGRACQWEREPEGDSWEAQKVFWKWGPNPAWQMQHDPSLTQHGESKEPSCLDTRHQNHTQPLRSLVLLAVDDWGSFPAWDFTYEACPVYSNCWDFWRGWLGYGLGNEHKELLLETKLRHMKTKWMSKLGHLLGLHCADKLTLDVLHLSASQLLMHGTSSPVCQESHSPLLECSHLWSRTQQLFKELTETNQGQDAKTQPKRRGKQGREKCQPSP